VVWMSEPESDDYDAILAGLVKEKNSDVLKKSPLARGRFKLWAQQNKRSGVDPILFPQYVDEATGELGDYTVGGAISRLEEALQHGGEEGAESEGGSSAILNLTGMIDWQKITEKEQMLIQLREQVQPVREMLEDLRKSGFLTAEKEREILGLEQRAPRLPIKQKQAFQDELQRLVAQRDKFKSLAENLSVPKPDYRIGDRVIYNKLVTEISDMGYNPQRKIWTYTVKTPEGIEYIVDYPDRELSFAPQIQAPALVIPVPPPVPITLPEIQGRFGTIPESEIEELNNVLTTYLVEHGMTRTQAENVVKFNRATIIEEAKNARTLNDARTLVLEIGRDILQRTPAQTSGTVTAETGRVTSLGGGFVSVGARTFESDTLEARIERERGYVLTAEEAAVLKLPLFQTVEKNAKYFSHPEYRGLDTLPGGRRNPARSYPKDLRELIQYYLEEGMVNQNELRGVGLRF